MKRLAVILTTLLLMFFPKEIYGQEEIYSREAETLDGISSQESRVISPNDSTIITINNDIIIKAVVKDWAAMVTSEAVARLSNEEVVRLIEAGRVTIESSFTHTIENEVFPALKGKEVVELTHWKNNNGFITTESEWITKSADRVNVAGSLSHISGLGMAIFTIFLLLWQRKEVDGRLKKSIFAAASLAHITMLAIIAIFGWLYELFPSSLMGAAVVLVLVIAVLISYLLMTEISKDLKTSGLIFSSLLFFTCTALAILAVPAKLGFTIIIIPGLLFFGSYMAAEILMIFEPEVKTNIKPA